MFVTDVFVVEFFFKASDLVLLPVKRLQELKDRMGGEGRSGHR